VHNQCSFGKYENLHYKNQKALDNKNLLNMIDNVKGVGKELAKGVIAKEKKKKKEVAPSCASLNLEKVQKRGFVGEITFDF